jgi:hypothetical protein
VVRVGRGARPGRGRGGRGRRWTPRSATAWRAATPRRWTRSGGPPPLRGRRAARLAPRVVPKLGTRTLGADLLE